MTWRSFVLIFHMELKKMFTVIDLDFDFTLWRLV